MRSEYQFVSTDTEETVSWLVGKYEEITGVSVLPASPEKLFILFVANALIAERVKVNYVGNQNIPSRAEGENLDALAELVFGAKRSEAQPSRSTLRFTISEEQSIAVLVPKGTRVTDVNATLYWQTVEDVYVPIGDTTVDVSAECLTPGTEGNGYAIGQINTIVDVFSYYSAVTNLTESDGGSDAATDEEFYERMRASMDSYSTAGARGAYEYHALNVSTEIGDVVANTPNPGYVNIYVLMRDGTLATSEVKAAVLAACNDDTVRPLTDFVSVVDAATQTYNINFTYYIPRNAAKSAAQIEADVEKAVEEYKVWQSAKLGRDINPDKLRDLVLATGVKRLTVTSPVFTALSNGRDNTQPKVAAVGTVNIVNGGYEDE